MAALDFLNLDLSLVSAFRLVEKLGSIISWMCPYFAAACKTDNSVREDSFTCWLSVVWDCQIRRLQVSSRSITRNYAAVGASGWGEQSWHERTPASSLPSPTQGAAVWAAWADSCWQGFNPRWPLLSEGNSSVAFFCLFFTDGKHLKCTLYNFLRPLVCLVVS